jgi:hypothetical protein
MLPRAYAVALFAATISADVEAAIRRRARC